MDASPPKLLKVWILINLHVVVGRNVHEGRRSLIKLHTVMSIEAIETLAYKKLLVNKEVVFSLIMDILKCQTLLANKHFLLNSDCKFLLQNQFLSNVLKHNVFRNTS